MPSESWRLWYRDTFDRDSGTSLELEGSGLEAGLVQLWVRYLGEELNGFSAFALQLEDRTLDLGGPRATMERLNQWVFEGRSVANGYLQAADPELITLLARVHAELRGDYLPLLTLIDSCETKAAFLEALAAKVSG